MCLLTGKIRQWDLDSAIRYLNNIDSGKQSLDGWSSNDIGTPIDLIAAAQSYGLSSE
jgi:hypothetical protein